MKQFCNLIPTGLITESVSEDIECVLQPRRQVWFVWLSMYVKCLKLLEIALNQFWSFRLEGLPIGYFLRRVNFNTFLKIPHQYFWFVRSASRPASILPTLIIKSAKLLMHRLNHTPSHSMMACFFTSNLSYEGLERRNSISLDAYIVIWFVGLFWQKFRCGLYSHFSYTFRHSFLSTNIAGQKFGIILQYPRFQQSFWDFSHILWVFHDKIGS